MARRKPQKLAWGIRKEGRSLWTRNAVRGVSVRGEKRKKDSRIEWRHWDPNKSKVAASLLKSKKETSLMIPEVGSTCLYLGASSGTTVSHIHDHVCGSGNHHNGQIIAVEMAPRMMRDLSKLSENRPGLIPVLGDARNPLSIAPYLRGKVDWIHQDISIADQTKSFLHISEIFLKVGGIGLLSLKAASERWIEGGDDSRFEQAKELIEADRTISLLENIDISHFESQHRVFVIRKNSN
ncbi:MAG: fibrillarin-like rRNA/tRNA 2'-O-methyltransferase [Euryarchaeota archaeon]|jgi:fibrillarin-like rRNA methylase|nr:fibrillarin-like rRNA/tRNA 2'-O-methyltransferase [Euryarchaeota archaeon]MBT6559816.1 fibrillarin-like rRNA/tRNA 2'-O-methyltransferase [Euryarchaeota archaeon]MBT7115668.1 fibrillarin-like rRNA/tRNA 2'-O-methyltransferase [Euryarchaeota archaeon]